MKKVVNFAFTSCLLLAFASFASAQNAVPAAGGDIYGTGGSVSYSVGQVVYTTDTSSTASVAQGVQQPYEISVVTGIANNNVNLVVKAYPNPVIDHLILKIKTTNKSSSYLVHLYDMEGRLILSKHVSNGTTEIPMNQISVSAYILKVISNNNKEVKTFKIVKN